MAQHFPLRVGHITAFTATRNARSITYDTFRARTTEREKRSEGKQDFPSSARGSGLKISVCRSLDTHFFYPYRIMNNCENCVFHCGSAVSMSSFQPGIPGSSADKPVRGGRRCAGVLSSLGCIDVALLAARPVSVSAVSPGNRTAAATEF